MARRLGMWTRGFRWAGPLAAARRRLLEQHYRGRALPCIPASHCSSQCRGLKGTGYRLALPCVPASHCSSCVQGQLQPGPPLDAVGEQQAAALAESLRGEVFDCLYTSDLLRATQTAEALGAVLGCRPVASPLLRERNLGERLSGLTYAEAQAQVPECHAALMSQSLTERIPVGAAGSPPPGAARAALPCCAAACALHF